MPLQFTPSQIKILDQIEVDKFIDRVIKSMLKRKVGVSPELESDELLRRVRAGVNCGKSFGLENNYSLAMVVDITFIIGPGFYKYPPIAYTLKDKKIKHNVKIDRLLEELDDAQWDDASRRAELDSWDDFCEEYLNV